MQAECLKDGLGVAGQGLMLRNCGLGPGDSNHLDFVELVLSNQTTGISPVAARLASKARGMGHVAQALLTQLVRVVDLASSDVGHRHLGGRGKIKTVLTLDTKRVIGKFR